jgi:hypothetical protein
MSKRVIQILVLCGLAALSSAAQKSSAICEVKVTTPQPGDRVGRDGESGALLRSRAVRICGSLRILRT